MENLFAVLQNDLHFSHRVINDIIDFFTITCQAQMLDSQPKVLQMQIFT